MNFLRKLMGRPQVVEVPPSPVINSSTPEYPTPKHVYLHLLSRWEEGEGEFVMFTRFEADNTWVQVQDLLGDVEINFAYPHDEEPDGLLSSLRTSLPDGFALSRWKGSMFASYRGPKCPYPELAECVDSLFTAVLKAPRTSVIGGWIG